MLKSAIRRIDNNLQEHNPVGSRDDNMAPTGLGALVTESSSSGHT